MNGISLQKFSRFDRTLHTSASVLARRWNEKNQPPFQSELKNPVAEVFGPSEAWPEDQVMPNFRPASNLHAKITLF